MPYNVYDDYFRVADIAELGYSRTAVIIATLGKQDTEHPEEYLTNELLDDRL